MVVTIRKVRGDHCLLIIAYFCVTLQTFINQNYCKQFSFRNKSLISTYIMLLHTSGCFEIKILKCSHFYFNGILS